MRQALDKLILALEHLKNEGVSGVELSTGTIDQLRRQADTIRDANPPTVPHTTPSSQVELVPARVSTPPPPSPPSARSSSSILPSLEAPPLDAPTLPAPPVLTVPSGSRAEQLAWLSDQVLSCPVCKAHLRPGKKLVFGVGSAEADIFFCGEAPGADEEIIGEPFVGEAGKLLTRIIRAMGLTRESVYIGNIMKWRPETGSDFGNRPPTQEEMGFCLPYLKAQLSIIRPKVIVGLGATALNGLLGYDPDRRISRIRGQWFNYEDTPLIATFHPSYVNRNGTMKVKRMVWEDMLAVMDHLGTPVSPKQRAYFTQ